jgi:hypothetical protein
MPGSFPKNVQSQAEKVVINSNASGSYLYIWGFRHEHPFLFERSHRLRHLILLTTITKRDLCA